MSDISDSLDEQVKRQVISLRQAVEEHKRNMDRALEALQQLSNGKLSLIQFKDLKAALGSFTTARASVEAAKRLVKAKLQEALKEGPST